MVRYGVQQLRKLLTCLGVPSDVDPIKHKKLLISFDEADTLISYINVVKKETEVTHHLSLLRCINLWAPFTDVLALFLSRTPDLSSLAPHAFNVPSNRYVSNTDTLLPPIVETPFDCGPGLPMSLYETNKLTREKVTSLEFLVKFGRPL